MEETEGTGSSRRRRRVPRAVTVTAVIAVVLIVLGGLVWTMQRSLIYLPSGGDPGAAAAAVDGAEDVRLHTDDGLELGAWYIPAQEADRDAAVLVTPGNAGNREGRLPLARALADEGFAVLLFDYRGYGDNPGSPTEGGLASDAQAAADALNELGYSPERTLYFGESLGAGVATGLAAERPPAGLFLRSPFSSLGDMAAALYPFVPRAMVRDTYPVRETVESLEVPTSVAVGDADMVVPPEQSHEVAESSANLFEVTELAGVGHNDPEMTHGPEVVEAFVRLADHAL